MHCRSLPVLVLFTAPFILPLLAAPEAVPDALVPVSAGSFMMGNARAELNGHADELPVRRVTLDAFLIARHEVSWRLWKRVHDWAVTHGYVFDNPGRPGYHTTDEAALFDEEGLPMAPVVPAAPPARTNAAPDDTHPVTAVSWYDVVKWCNARSEMEKKKPCYYTDSAHRTVYRKGRVNVGPSRVRWAADGWRLPTEAEWECAAAGGHFPEGEKRTIYAGSDDADAVAWHDGNSGGGTHPVGGKQPNALGLFDMSGNALEWCFDRYDAAWYRKAPLKNPRGPELALTCVVRGGAFDTDVSLLRVAVRNGREPDDADGNVGFRVVRRP